MRAGSLTPWRPTRPPGDNPAMFSAEVRVGERAMLTTKATKSTKFMIKNIRTLRVLRTTMVESFCGLRKFFADSKLLNK